MTRRLIDKLLELDPANTAHPGSFAHHLKDAITIVADNVAKYYYEVETRTLKLDDLPNIAPPFDNMFIEWSSPKSINQDGELSSFDGGFKYYGTHIISIDLNIDDGSRKDFGLDNEHGVRWVLFVMAYMLGRNNSAATPMRQEICVRIHVNQDGSFNNIYHTILPWIDSPDMEMAAHDAGSIIGIIVVDFLSVSFMHCKNVEMIKSPALKKTKKRLQHSPRVRYYTLSINPMRKILDRNDSHESSGLKMALHICRGHFKDYSAGDGLFGKYKGLYWWESQVRGNAKHGSVIKDYSIKAVQS